MAKSKRYPLGTFMKEFSKEAKCWEYLANLRWPGGFVCPKCGCHHAYDVFIKSKEASKMIDLQKWAEQYLLICKYQKGLDTKTIKAYRIDISQFIEFAKLKKGELTRIVMTKFISELRKKHRPRTVRRKVSSIKAVHECCNYDNGNCIALDYGEPCVCVQSISYSLLCRWFISAVLPLDWKLEAALLHRAELKRCTECGGQFLPKSNRGKYCPDCAGRMKRARAAQRKRKQRGKCHACGIICYGAVQYSTR